jgi:uncharacterized membrane protein YagU involved in acid resistance
MLMDTRHILAGAWSGVIGGGAFGAMMGMMGMLPMVAMLVGSESVFVGVFVHGIISAITGAAFGLVFGHLALNKTWGIALGLLYGFIWWFLGPLIIMPVWLGMGLQLSAAGMSAAIPSLWGHLVWGFILGLVFSLTATRPQSEINNSSNV